MVSLPHLEPTSGAGSLLAITFFSSLLSSSACTWPARLLRVHSGSGFRIHL